MSETKNKTKEEQLEIEKNTKKAHRDFIMEYAPYVIIIAFVLVIRLFIATPVQVKGSSMYPTLKSGDVMLLYKLTKNVKGIDRFDIVVIKTDSGKLIKRVIGLPGETIKYEVVEKDDKRKLATLYVDGKKIKEEFITEEAVGDTCNGDWQVCSENGFTIPKGEYFVMGDNRVNSKDSRMIGTIPNEDILGTTEVILFPLNRIGKAK